MAPEALGRTAAPAWVQPDAVRTIVGASLEQGGGWLDPDTAARLFGAEGIRVAEARIAHSAEEAERIAGEVGLPVALKGLGASLLHKTEAGAVKLRLTDGPAVRAAFMDLEVRLGDRLDAVLVQRMIGGAVEMVVGGLNDPALGPVIMAGTGGIFVDLLGDTAFRMCPLTERDATDLIEELRGAFCFEAIAVRLRPISGISRAAAVGVPLLDACPEIEEMDLNPVMGSGKGLSCRRADQDRARRESASARGAFPISHCEFFFFFRGIFPECRRSACVRAAGAAHRRRAFELLSSLPFFSSPRINP